jgi:PAS domain S-box-containing protein
MYKQQNNLDGVIGLLKMYPEGMSINALSRTLDCHRNSVAKYLDILHFQGKVDLHFKGREKIYKLSTRIPFNTLKKINSHYILALEKDLNIVDINESFLQLLHWTYQKDVSCNIQTVPFSPFHDPLILQSIKNALDGMESSRIIEAQIDTKTRHFELKCLPTIFDDKKIGVALLIDENLGERELEETLDLWKERYRILSENQDEYIVRFFPDGTISFINEAYCRTLGIPSEEIVGRKFKPFIPKADEAILKKHFATLTKDNPVATVEHRCILPDGSIQWHRWKDRCICKNGIIVEYRSVGFDITDFKLKEDQLRKFQEGQKQLLTDQAEELRNANEQLIHEMSRREKIENALKESERRYRAVVESQTELVCRWSPDGTLTFVNEAICRYMDIPREILLGQNCLNFLPEEDQRYVIEYLSSMTPSNPNGHFRHRINLPNGKTLWQEWTCTIIFDKEGRPIEFQSVGRDITDLIQAEEKNKNTLSLLNSTLESTADGILVVDKTGKIVKYNQKFAQMWHIPDAILETNDDKAALDYILNQLINPDEFLEKVKQLYSHPESVSNDILKFKDGRVFERYSQPQRIDDQIIGRVWSFRNITGQCKGEMTVKNQ